MGRLTAQIAVSFCGRTTLDSSLAHFKNAADVWKPKHPPRLHSSMRAVAPRDADLPEIARTISSSSARPRAAIRMFERQAHQVESALGHGRRIGEAEQYELCADSSPTA